MAGRVHLIQRNFSYTQSSHLFHSPVKYWSLQGRHISSDPTIPHIRRAYSHKAIKSRTERLAQRIPPGTWDTHMHVVNPHTFPLDKAALYQPQPHTMTQAQAYLTTHLNIHKMVIVQPSIYGNDNACTLDGLRQLGPTNGRAVIQFDPATTSRAQLREWHDLGVRGVRLNFKSVGITPTAEHLAQTLHAYADAVREFGWFLEVYIGIEQIPLLEPVIALGKSLGGVPVCIDHVGHPSAESLAAVKDARNLPGFDTFMRLLDGGEVWVKISATYRLSRDVEHGIVEGLTREVLRRRPDRCVFATDWPHTRCDDVEVEMYLEKILDWCEAEGVKVEDVLAKNADALLDGRQ